MIDLLFALGFLGAWILASVAAERWLSDETWDKLLHIFRLE